MVQDNKSKTKRVSCGAAHRPCSPTTEVELKSRREVISVAMPEDSAELLKRRVVHL